MDEGSEPRDFERPAEGSTAIERQREDGDLGLHPESALPAHAEGRVLVFVAAVFKANTHTNRGCIREKRKRKRKKTTVRGCSSVMAAEASGVKRSVSDQLVSVSHTTGGQKRPQSRLLPVRKRSLRAQERT